MTAEEDAAAGFSEFRTGAAKERREKEKRRTRVGVVRCMAACSGLSCEVVRGQGGVSRRGRQHRREGLSSPPCRVWGTMTSDSSGCDGAGPGDDDEEGRRGREGGGEYK